VPLYCLPGRRKLALEAEGRSTYRLQVHLLRIQGLQYLLSITADPNRLLRACGLRPSLGICLLHVIPFREQKGGVGAYEAWVQDPGHID
jgi:hypothetical protein